MRLAWFALKKFYPVVLVLAALIIAFWPGFTEAHYIPKLSLFFLGAAILTFKRLWRNETVSFSRAQMGFAGGVAAMIVMGFLQGNQTGISLKSGMLLVAVTLYVCLYQRPTVEMVRVPRYALIAAWLLMVWATVIGGAETFVTKGMAQLRGRQYRPAEMSFKAAVRLDHWNNQAWLGLSYLAAIAGQNEKSVRFLNRCEDHSAEATRKISAIHRRMSGFKQAKR